MHCAERFFIARKGCLSFAPLPAGTFCGTHGGSQRGSPPQAGHRVLADCGRADAALRWAASHGSDRGVPRAFHLGNLGAQLATALAAVGSMRVGDASIR